MELLQRVYFGNSVLQWGLGLSVAIFALIIFLVIRSVVVRRLRKLAGTTATDIDDFIGKSFTTAPDGKLYQLPDQQFANLYWFRYDWFNREDFKKKFKEIYGYELGVPVNWSAYEDIAEFFSEHIQEINGRAIYGHNDYGKKAPDLGWRFTDAWLSMAGAGDIGIPNGVPVDEWGIRVDGCRPVGSSVARGGAANGPAAVYALRKYIDWLKRFAPPEAAGMTFSEAGPVPGAGRSASGEGGPRLPPARWSRKA